MPAAASSIAPVHTDATVAPPRWISAIRSGTSPRWASPHAPVPSRVFQPPPGTTTMSQAREGPRSSRKRAPWEAVIVAAPWAPTSSAWISAPFSSAVRSTSYGPSASSSSNPSKRMTSIVNMAGSSGPARPSASGRTALVRKDPARYPRAMHEIAVLAVDSVVAFDLSIPAQIFGHRDERHRYRLTVCAEHAGPVPTSTAFAIVAGADLAALRSADTVIVPGFEHTGAEIPAAVLAAVRAADRRSARMLSICTGAFVLAAAGILDGRRATTHWRHTTELSTRYPAIDLDPNVLYVDD